MNQKIHTRGQVTQVEQVADGVIQPGALVMQTATGVAVHGTSGGAGESMFAQEDALQGRTVADDYAAAEPVTSYVEQPGNLGLARLKTGYAYTVGMQLISGGDGTLIPTTGTPAKVFAICIKAIDLSASGALTTLSPVRYL